ncbi:MAG: FadR family transcriptional regulator [Lentisphaeria bacterium]|nr:FadR family transcriptional regulator [Lentisphaeria bacterium]
MKREIAAVQPTLTEQVVGKLLEYIQSNRLGGGEELPTESELMKLLQVSRGALREALCHLKALGIVSSRRGSGFRVNDPDIVNAVGDVIRHLVRTGRVGLRKLYEHHRILELGCVGDAVSQATDEHRIQIERARAAYEEAARADVPFPVRIDLAEIAFHQALMASAGCRTLEVINAILYDFFERRLTDQSPYGYERSYLEQVIREHAAVADAYLIRSPEAAYFALRHHLNWSEDALRECELRERL